MPQTFVDVENQEKIDSATGTTTVYDIYNSEGVNKILEFFPFGLNGMWKGATILLFSFIAFDAMVYSSNGRNAVGNNFNFNESSSSSPTKTTKVNGNGKTVIQNFHKTLPSSILSINGILLVCLFGVAVALTLIRPYYLLVSLIHIFLYFHVTIVIYILSSSCFCEIRNSRFFGWKNTKF